jgi:predicted aldo/keto reductase-like oxidoreductase
MGCLNAHSDGLLRRAYDLGVRHFDTAAGYLHGLSEEVLGRVVKELGAREQVLIGTKVHIPPGQRDIPGELIRQAYTRTAEQSLARLQTDHIDIFYSHNATSVDWLRNEAVLDALGALKKAGKARYLGFSTHSNMAECIAAAAEMDVYDVVLTTFNLAHWQNEQLLQAIRAASAKGMGVIAMKTQCTYTSRQHEPWSRMRDRLRGHISQTALLKWVLRHPEVATAVPGCTSMGQIEENFAVAYDLEYDEAERRFLEQTGARFAAGFCLQCGQCVETCPQRVAVPDLMRAHMYSTAYGNPFEAERAVHDIPDGRGLDRCAGCRQCHAQCRRGVDVAERIGELKRRHG